MNVARLLIIAVAWAATAATETATSVDEDEKTLRAAGLSTEPKALLEYFRKKSPSAAELERYKELVGRLGNDAFDVREKAQADLVALGPIVIPFLKEAVKSPDLEVSRRAEECLRQIQEGATDRISEAAARALARSKAPGATETLLRFLPFVESESVADAVRQTLAQLAVRDGAADDALVKGLADREDAIRAAAGEALARAAAPNLLPEVRKLLGDKAPDARLRVGLALARRGEKEAIPVLIELLGSLPPERAWTIEDLLLRLAGDKAPSVSLGRDDNERARCKEAWSAWWKANADQIDFAVLDKTPDLLGNTLVVLLDEGKVVELDRKNRPLWQVDNLEFPLDVQPLPGERILVAEMGANKVTERDRKGKILWQHAVDEPLVAQRLPSGNTFIANRDQAIEVDRQGKVVSSVSLSDGEQIMRAVKLRNGDIALVSTNGRFVRLDANGKELKSFPVTVSTSGGRIDVLPNGNVLIPMLRENRIVEYDGGGKKVWEATFEQPISAIRLPNGNTLATSMTQKKAAELDPKGNVVWEYKGATRVTRAWRR